MNERRAHLMGSSARMSHATISCMESRVVHHSKFGGQFGLPAIFAIGPLLIRKWTFAPHRQVQKVPGSEVGQPDSINSLAMANCFGGTASSSSSKTFCLHHNHIGGVTPSRPTRHARPCSVPSGCVIAAIKTFAPGLRSLLSPETTMGVFGGTKTAQP
jgi:hypothetical protein